jgi:hypothetical protein
LELNFKKSTIIFMSTTEENELEKGLMGSKSDDIILDQEN